MTILIVDDSPTIRAVLRAMVEKMGHSALEAGDGHVALHMLQQARPDLVLIDVVMPVMDGYEGARRMREMGGPDDRMPIIFLSSNESDQDLGRAMEAGGDDYLVKPVSFEVLKAKIHSVRRIGSAGGSPQGRFLV